LILDIWMLNWVWDSVGGKRMLGSAYWFGILVGVGWKLLGWVWLGWVRLGLVLGRIASGEIELDAKGLRTSITTKEKLPREV